MSKVTLEVATPDLEANIAKWARVSNPANENNTATAGKLLKYLMDHKHWSPFEMGNIVMKVETTRDISRQILRHRSFFFQEYSQRYASADSFSIRECRMQDTKNRQNSLETEDYFVKTWWDAAQKRAISDAYQLYTQALEQGIAKEQARVLLPEGLTETTLYMNGTVRSWIHYCQLRCGKETQKEHREVAEQARVILQSLLPSLEI